MFPSWARGMLVRAAILASACLGIFGVVWLLSGNLGQGREGPSPGGAANQPVKNNGAQIDPNQPRNDEVKVGQDAPSGAKEVKARQDGAKLVEKTESMPISLNEAISLVEKAGKGEVVKGEKWGEGTQAQFNLEVLGQKGVRIYLVVNATGKVVVETPEATKAKKGKKKDF